MAGQAKTFSGKWVVKIWLRFDARETICFRKTNQRGGDGNLEGREGALRNADQTVHKEAMEQVPKCRFILVPGSLMAKSMFRSLMQKYSQDFHTGKTGMIGNKLDKWIPVRKLTLKPRYFDDPWQHLPKDGYTRMFENMLLKVLFWCELFLCFHFQDPKITVRVATDYFQVLWLMIKKVIIIF